VRSWGLRPRLYADTRSAGLGTFRNDHPSRDFTAEEFLGHTLTTCRGAGGCVSVFQGSSLTLGEMADACVYVGGGANVDSKAKPTQLR
jgi:hypothetical protein